MNELTLAIIVVIIIIIASYLIKRKLKE